MRWTKQEITDLSKTWKTATKPDLRLMFDNRSWKSIQRKAESLRLNRNRQPYCGKSPITKEPSWFVGEMLGDGHVSPIGQYQHTAKNEEHIELLTDLFLRINVPSTYYKSVTFDSRTQKHYTRFCLKTPCLFKSSRTTWYPEGTKIVPPKLKIDHEVMLHWIWGDGTIAKNMFRLCTMNFTINNLNLLKEKLSLYGLETTRQKSGAIYVRRNDQNKKKMFCLLPRLATLECYRYKADRLEKWIKKGMRFT